MIKIDKIELVGNNESKVIIESSEINRFFIMSKVSFKRPLKTFSLKLNKIKLISLSVKTLFRKIKGKRIALTEKNLLSLILPNVKIEKIVQLNLYIDNKKMSYDLNKIHLMNLLGDLRGVILNNQYNVKKENIKNKIVVDAGAHNGEFSILTALLGAKKVYAFEPVLETAEILKKNIKMSGVEDKVIVVRKALGDKNEEAEIHFDFLCDGGAAIGKKGNSKEKIDVVKLDDFVKSEKVKRVDFIKMDIEGFEEKALRGARKIIKKDKPILSLSAYHKQTDKKILPKVIKSIRNDYQIKLNKFDEEDFYCY